MALRYRTGDGLRSRSAKNEKNFWILCVRVCLSALSTGGGSGTIREISDYKH